MKPEDVLLDGETQFVKVRAARGCRPNTPKCGGKLIVTEHRTMFHSKQGFESIAHQTLNGITVTEHPENRKYEAVAGLLAMVGIAAGAFWAVMYGNVATWEAFLLPFVTLGSFIGAAITYRLRTDYYETIELHLPTETKQFSANEEDAFVTASKIISQNWKRRDPKF